MEIKVKCFSDQGLEGIVRICEMDIEDNKINNDKATNDKVFNVLGQKEYNTTKDNWREEVVNDIRVCIGDITEDIDVIVE